MTGLQFKTISTRLIGKDKDYGFVSVGATYDTEGNPTAYSYDWYGGDVCSLTFTHLEDSDLSALRWEREKGIKGMIPGDEIQIGPYIVEVLKIDSLESIVHCRRVHEKEEVVNDK